MKDSELFHGLKSCGACGMLFARSATSGVPSESRLFLVALRGVNCGKKCNSSNGYAYVPHDDLGVTLGDRSFTSLDR